MIYFENRPALPPTKAEREARAKADAYGCCFGWLIGGLLLIALTLCSCRTTVREVPVVVTQEHTIESVKIDHVRDTLVQRDSVFYCVRGDTVRIEKWHYLQGTTNIIKVDTLVRTDSVPYPVRVEVTKEVERKLRWYEKWLMRTGGITLLLLAFGAAWKIGKRS